MVIARAARQWGPRRMIDRHAPAGAWTAGQSRPIGLRRTIALWRERLRYRRDLRRLLKVGPHMIDDIGLTLREARRQAATPFWHR